MKLTFSKPKKEEASTHFTWNPLHPRRDWERMLLAFIVLVLGVAAWSAYLFVSSEKQAVVETVQPSADQNDTSAEIGRIESFFEKR